MSSSKSSSIFSSMVLMISLCFFLVSAYHLQVSTAWATVTEEFVVYAGDRAIGTLVAEDSGESISVTYTVDDNGRGPKLQEIITLGRDGLPAVWDVSGTGWSGAAAEETYRYEDGKATWQSLAEQGNARSKTNKPYIPTTASPWFYGVYARLLLTDEDNRLEVFPTGEMRLDKLDTLLLDHQGEAVPVTAYELNGLGLAPVLLLLDDNGDLVARLSFGTLLRKGFEENLDRLQAYNTDFEDLRKQRMHEKLAHKMDAPWHVTNVRIFDPVSKSLGQLSTVTVFGNRIVNVTAGPANQADSGETVFDGDGGVLMSGLVDMHAHTFAGDLMYHQLAAGITTVRDMGGANEEVIKIPPKKRAGLVDAPRIVMAGFLEKSSPFSANTQFVVDSLDEARDAVHWYANRGYRFLKTYNSIPKDWLPALAEEAHGRGMRVVGHVPGFAYADDLLQAGYDEVTHLNQLMLQFVLDPSEDTRTLLRVTAMSRFADLDLGSQPVRETIAILKDQNAAVDTTMALMERLTTQRNGETLKSDSYYIHHMPLNFQRGRRNAWINVPDEETDQNYFKARDKMIDMIALLKDEGIPLLPGTDDYVAYSLHWELQLYTEAGFTPAEVLSIDTYETIKYLGLDDELGGIDRGKLADFILLPENPLEDIMSLRKVNLVVSDGIIYYPAEIYQELNVKPFSDPPAASIVN